MTQIFHSQEKVSAQASESDANDQERRRVPRLALTHEQLRHGPTGKIFSLIDLSEQGLSFRLLDGEELIHFPVGSEFKGWINLKRLKYEITAKVRHLGKDWVGISFGELSVETRLALQSFTNPENLGTELRPLPSPDGALWFHGPSGTDIFFWLTPELKVSRMLLIIHGFYVAYDHETLKTGQVSSNGERIEMRGLIQMDSLPLVPDAVLDVNKLSIAKRLTLSSNLSVELKKWCIRTMEG
jgi:hypothetical protein